MIELRDYQRDACDAAMTWLAASDGDPVIVIPTGGGKTPVIAELCRRVACDWGSRVLVVSHVKELIAQSASTLRRMIDGMDVGIYSASLTRKDTGHLVTVAQIQSLARAPIEAVFADISLMIVDEAHLIPDADDSQYRSVIERLRECNPAMKMIGLTATPYRTKSGAIVSRNSMFSGICYEVGIRQLLADGYLSPLFAREPGDEGKRIELENVHIRMGEYDADETGAEVEAKSRAIAAEIVTNTVDRNSVLVFCPTIQAMEIVENAVKNAISNIRSELLEVASVHWSIANLVFDPANSGELLAGCDWLMDHDKHYNLGLHLAGLIRAKTACVTGMTDQSGRDKIMRDFVDGSTKFLLNVGVATTGFDAPNVDCVALLRATQSPGLYYQICGRGLRKSPKKKDCLLLDFGGNVRRHGPIDRLNERIVGDGSRPLLAKEPPEMVECTECGTLSVIGEPCPRCNASTTPIVTDQAKLANMESKASSDQPLSDIELTEWHVIGVSYSVHRKKMASPDKPRTLRVDYDCVPVSDEYPADYDWSAVQQMELDLMVGRKGISEWVCVEHDGFARKKAVKWWRSRSAMVMPSRAVEAMQAGRHGLIGRPARIWAVPDGPYTRIERVDGVVIPRIRPACPVCEDTRPRVIMQGRHGEIDTIICRNCDHVYGDATTDDMDRWGVWDVPPSGEIVCDTLTTLADGSLMASLFDDLPDNQSEEIPF
jgi:DNA repair protein RadD